jgi:hypothetical protein
VIEAIPNTSIPATSFACGPGWICGGSDFLAGAAVGHDLGVIGVDLTRRAGFIA